MVYGAQDYAELLKKIIKDGLRHDLYHDTVEHANAMGVHVNGDKPFYLLERSRPREDEEVRTYRLDNYEPTTKAGSDKALKIISRVCNPLLSSIQFLEKNDEAEQLESYTTEYYPIYNSLLNYNKDVILKKMLADPNGIIAVKLSDLPGSDTETTEPICVTYGSSAIWYYDRDHYLICVKEPAETDKDKIHEFEYYDRNQYLKFEAWYDASTKEIHINEIDVYPTKFNQIPVWFLGGESKPLDNGKIIYESFFASALPHWNLAIIHESDLLGAYITHLHPQKYEITEDCAHVMSYEGQTYQCRGGLISYPGGKEGSYIQSPCDVCGGSGRTAVKSPYGVYQFTREKIDDAQTGGLTPVGYITIPVEATKMLEERCEKLVSKGMASINMDVEEKVGEIQSGVAKTIDRSAQNDTLFTIAARVFDVHLPNMYDFINKYMHGVKANSTQKEADKNLPEINKPTKFDLLTTAEHVNNFEVAKKAGMDRNVLRVKSIEIVNSDLGSTPNLKNYLVALIELDPLFGYESDEIDLGVSKGVIRKVDWAIHNNIKPFLDKAILADKKFLTKTKDIQIEALEKFGTELIAAEQPRIDEAIMMTFEKEEKDAA
jgi:hypothetical protein